jgi:hypothetical protein
VRAGDPGRFVSMRGADLDRLLALVAVLLGLDVAPKAILGLLLVYLWWRSHD